MALDKMMMGFQSQHEGQGSVVLSAVSYIHGRSVTIFLLVQTERGGRWGDCAIDSTQKQFFSFLEVKMKTKTPAVSGVSRLRDGGKAALTITSA